jgi:hypothetical protein
MVTRLRSFAILGALLWSTGCGDNADEAARDSARRARAARQQQPAEPAPPPMKMAPVPAWPQDTQSVAISAVWRPRDARNVPSCGGTTPTVSAEEIGMFYPGQPLPNVFGLCGAARPGWRYDDGVYVPAVLARQGRATIVATLSGIDDAATVSRVEVHSAARTVDGIGPGSTLADLQRVFGTPNWRREQCGVSATFDSHPGLLVHIQLPENTRETWNCGDIRDFGKGPDFSLFPRGSTVGWIAAFSGL